ncbi:transposase [Rahnella sp. AA]|uniref:transposase n=1 Tax=Rahnella sp. AA TaxID=2057180 RepID=UPI00351296AB
MFTPEFKRECAEFVLKHGYIVPQACEATNVRSTAIRRWVKHLRQKRSLGCTSCCHTAHNSASRHALRIKKSTP